MDQYIEYTELCYNCNSVIIKTNEIHRAIKENITLIWCKRCFDKLWKTALNDGWGGDDIEKRLEAIRETNKNKHKEKTC